MQFLSFAPYRSPQMWLQVVGLLAVVGSSGAFTAGRLKQPDDMSLDIARWNPLNYVCNPSSADTVENLKDYELLLESGAGKSVYVEGDSMMSQVYYAVHCAADILGWPVDEKIHDGVVTLTIRNNSSAPIHTAFRLTDRIFYRISDLTGKDLLTPKFTELFSERHDLYAFNIGHYIFLDPVNFTSVAQGFFAGLKKAADATASRVAFLDHSPQHFNTDTGNYWEMKTAGLADPPDAKDCSCTQPHLRQQYTSVNNGLAASLALQSGFDYVALWDDMNLCNEHPIDCTHLRLSPVLFKPVIRSLTKIVADLA